MSVPEPTIGRTVRYMSYGSADGTYPSVPRAAIVTAVGTDDDKGTISLAVLNPTGLFFDLSVPYSEEPRAGHWSWPTIG